MRPLDLALRYMKIFYSDGNVDELFQLFANDFTFSGPLYKFDSREDYIKSLKSDPPIGFVGLEYKIISSFENEFSACLVYQFTKPGISVPMAQIFNISNNKISNILLIFDTSVFLDG